MQKSPPESLCWLLQCYIGYGILVLVKQEIPVAYERNRRVILIVNEKEHRAIRLKAADLGVSISEMGREVLLAFAREHMVIKPRLPGMDEEGPPDWLQTPAQ